MMIIEATGWIATVLILVGYYLNAKQRLSSWVVWFFGNLLMLVYSVLIGATPQVALALVLVIMNVFGFISWSKKNDKFFI